MAAILGVLLFVALPDIKTYLARAGEARCMANMRNITLGLHGYLQDNRQVWPQGPSPDADEAWENFWLGALRPYGVTESTWQCPTISRMSGAEGPRVHYIPTMFPATPNIANRWSTHPWLIERENAHGKGALIGFSDGPAKSFDKVLAELGVR